MILKGVEFHPDYDNHSRVCKFEDRSLDIVAYIALHKELGDFPAFGATRYWYYSNDNEAIKDVLRLSKGMSFKSALAGLPYGGGKAVILRKSNHDKYKVLDAYSDFVNQLNGSFITGADVGLSSEDVSYLYRRSKYIVGVNIDPVEYTVLGIYLSILASLRNVLGSEDLQNRSIAIQGIGKVGLGLLKQIYGKAAEIYVSDINNALLEEVSKQFPKINIVPVSDILKLDVDVLAPCALGGVITHRNVNNIKATIICGGANNQLESEDLAKKLLQNNIVYVPDYVVNGGGLISVVSEFEKLSEADTKKKVENIAHIIDELFVEQRIQQKPLNIVAAQWGVKHIDKGQRV